MIRLAVPSETQAVTDLVNAAYTKYIERIGRKPMPMTMDYGALIGKHEVYVLEADAGIAGVLVLEIEPDDLLIENIAVAPAAQGKGYGKQLMQFSENFARAQGLNNVRLYTNILMHENIAMYTRWGFVETGREVQDGFGRVFMRKKLA